MSEHDERRELLFYNQKNGWDFIEESEKEKIFSYCEEYKAYLNRAKTEREAVDAAIALAEEAGFVPYKPGMGSIPGTKVYCCNRGKSLMLAVIGERLLIDGAVIAGAHVDSPRLDLKQNPMYEEDELCYFKTHYYGGLRKYQWVTIPLELHGCVARKDGTLVNVVIGNEKEDPLFTITDLLPHLSADQNKRTLAEGITGEGLNLIIGSVPDSEEGKDRVKLNILTILHQKYGITEEDFLSAELMAVPAFAARDLGLDRSLIGAYGHDDRVCAYASLKAIMDVNAPEYTCVCILADKEEIGSEGVTGMQSEAFECFMDDLCQDQGVPLYHCFENSFCLSSDVCNAFDPNFPEVSEKRNSARLNYGLGVMKFTGARGKSGSSDATAETVAKIRRIFAENQVQWQMAELGKVDQGGGGTIAKFMAARNIDTIDAGVPVLSMHAPYEVVAKFDCYMAYKGTLSVFQNDKN